jgi:hypothetical protein
LTFAPSNEIHWMSLKENGTEVAQGPGPLRAPPGAKGTPAISPDGRWIAYSAVSDNSNGRFDVYLARFPEGTGRVQITSSGGNGAFWSRRGDELLFQGPPAGQLYSVPVKLGAERAQIGAQRVLFNPEELNVDIQSTSPDGTRFLAVKRPRIEPTREIVVVEHWLDELRRAVPIH